MPGNLQLFDSTAHISRTMRRLISAGLLLYSMVAIADVCPSKGETIQTIAYTKSFQCPIGTIHVEGAANPEKYQSCLGDVPAAKEQVWLTRKGLPSEILPSVRSLSPEDNALIQHKLWVVAKVACDGPTGIHIDFWGGGNCDQCTKSVEYEFDGHGGLKNTHIK
ncbi:hypothetical protein [Paraburkholderia sp. ZP32-5]|uniref:hypothetical protein n=1 Tax=Paraburkholderia sp. ZP32-5 TaxID=2883245 RepID=UPI001F30BC73|nr:hypothetical protein [Paraburkholderia sp. ZP32-5]